MAYAERSRKYKEMGHKPPSAKGLLWWNNGVDQRRSSECPGEGYKRGRLKNGTRKLCSG